MLDAPPSLVEPNRTLSEPNTSELFFSTLKTTIKMKTSIAASILGFALAASAGPARIFPRNFYTMMKRGSLPVPQGNGTETFSEPKEITGVFDGGLKTYGRGVSCTGQAEGGNSDAVFLLKDGATLKNAIIGKDQIEGVHCEGSCTIENVWWVSVCEDALTLKGDGDATGTFNPLTCFI